MIRNPYLFFFILMLLFFFDMSIFTFFEHPYVQCVLALYVMQLFQSFNFVRLTCTALVLAIESFIFYDYVGAPLLYMIPITWASMALQTLLYKSRLYPFFLYIICLGLNILIIEWLLAGIDWQTEYTTTKIIANIGVIWCLSLIFPAQGKLSNRS